MLIYMPTLKILLCVIFATVCLHIPVKAHPYGKPKAETLKFHRFGLCSYMSDGRMVDIEEDKEGGLWFSAMNGLYRFDGYSLKTYASGNGANAIPDSRACHLYLDRNGDLWILSKAIGTYSLYNYSTDDFCNVSPNKVPDKVKENLADKKYEEASYGGMTWKRQTHLLTCIVTGGKNTIRYEAETARQAGLDDDNVTALLIDSNRKLWVGTASHGVYYTFLDKSPKIYLSTHCNAIRSICADEGNGIYIGYDHGGVWHSDNNRLKIEKTVYGGMADEEGCRIRDIMLDYKKRLWVATRNGIYIQQDDGTSHHILLAKPRSSPTNRIYKLLEDKKRDKVWIGGWGGLAAVSISNLNIVVPLDTAINKIHDMAISQDGSIWVATENGIHHIESDSIRHMEKGRICYSVDIAEDGTIWCGTANGIIYKRVGMQQWQHLPQIVSANQIARGLVCKGADIYVATSSVMLRINGTSLKAELINAGEYDYAEGASFFNHDTGEVMFGSLQGILAIDSNIEVAEAEEGLVSQHIYTIVTALLAVCLTALMIVFIRRRKRKARKKEYATAVQPEEIGTMAPDFVALQNSEFLDKAHSIATAHIGDPEFGADMFAQEMAMSRAQLFRKIKSATGQTAMDYVMSLRTERAEELLRTSTMTISEIACSCGFYDSAAFRRNFQKRYGVTPSQYRTGKKQ